MAGNLEALIAAGLINRAQVTDEQQTLIDRLTPEEISAIISAHKKLGTENVKKLNTRDMTIF